MDKNSIQNTFINALLADASYVDDLSPDGVSLSGKELIDQISKRLTPALAKYLDDHFEVVTQKLTNDSSERASTLPCGAPKTMDKYMYL